MTKRPGASLDVLLERIDTSVRKKLRDSASEMAEGTGGAATVESAAVARAIADATIETRLRSGMDEGHHLVAQIRWALSHMGFTYTDSQMQFHDMMLYATLPILFGRDWDMYKPEILAHYGRERHSPRVVMSMPRSGGKTQAIVTFLAAFMWATVDRSLLLVCFSIQKDQSSWVMSKTYQCLCRLPNGERMTKKNSSTMAVSMRSQQLFTAAASATVLRAQSGNAAGGRGLQPDIIILEEAAFISTDVYTKTVFPMLCHEKRAVFAISSPGDASGFFASLFRMRFPKTNLPVFDSVKEENICERCMRAKRMSCDHVIRSRPRWKSKCVWVSVHARKPDISRSLVREQRVSLLKWKKCFTQTFLNNTRAKCSVECRVPRTPCSPKSGRIRCSLGALRRAIPSASCSFR